MSTIKSSAENLTLNADGANNDIKFQSNGSEVASIDQAGTVTATTFTGAATDATKLPLAGGTMTGNLVVGGGAARRISITSTDANGSAAINFLSTTNNAKNWEVGSNLHNSAGLEFTPSTANGNSTFTTPTVSFPIAGGITFGSDTAAANALDDYEEGEWTPVLVGSSTAGNHTYSTQKGYYEKIGRLVIARGQVVLNQKNTIAGNVTMSGLPFTQSNEAGSYSAVYAGYGGLMALTAGTSFAGYTNLNETTVTLTLWDNTAGINTFTASNINNGMNIVFALTYMV